MASAVSRKKLLKFLGKEAEFTATIGVISTTSDAICLNDVKYKGKLYADHIWTGRSHQVSQIPLGTEVRFIATATTYRDSKNNRKYGLCRVFHYEKVNKEYEAEIQNSLQRMKRISK